MPSARFSRARAIPYNGSASRSTSSSQTSLRGLLERIVGAPALLDRVPELHDLEHIHDIGGEHHRDEPDDLSRDRLDAGPAAPDRWSVAERYRTTLSDAHRALLYALETDEQTTGRR